MSRVRPDLASSRRRRLRSVGREAGAGEQEAAIESRGRHGRASRRVVTRASLDLTAEGVIEKGEAGAGEQVGAGGKATARCGRAGCW
jgi:hypothetical protein